MEPRNKSAEAAPRWFLKDHPPYDRTREDDQYWLSHLLDRQPFTAQFDFDEDGEEMLEKKVETDGDVDWLSPFGHPAEFSLPVLASGWELERSPELSEVVPSVSVCKSTDE